MGGGGDRSGVACAAMGAAPAYIAFEGTEGSGKSTHAARLASALGAVATRETGGTAIGERLRTILHDTAVADLDDRAEALIIAADRAQHFARVVLPALAAGRSVVSDRSAYSTLAYQGYGRGLDLDDLRRVNDWAMCGRWPDLVVFLDVDDDVAAARLAARQLDRFEQEGADFHRRVVDGFHALADADPHRWIVVRPAGTTDDVAAAIRAEVEGRVVRR